MIYYKPLEIDWEPVSSDIISYLEKNPHLIEKGEGSWRIASDWILENTNIQNIFEWPIDFIGIFVTHTNESSIHIDSDSLPVRITFPVINCDNTITKYYKFNGEANLFFQSNGISYNNICSNDVIEVDSFELTSAILMRVLEPHQVCVLHDNFPRVSCTVQFKENLEYLLEDL